MVPAAVAVTTEISAPSSASMALSIVAPEVNTSSTSTERSNLPPIDEKTTRPRRDRGAPARLGHQIGAFRACSTGSPVMTASSFANSCDGSMPYVTLRTRALGTGIRTVASRDTDSAIARARNRAAGRLLRYFILRTRFAAASRWRKAASATTPATRRGGTGRRVCLHGSHSTRAGNAHERHNTSRTYRLPVTNTADDQVPCSHEER